jgi:hypothetical protein
MIPINKRRNASTHKSENPIPFKITPRIIVIKYLRGTA